MIQSWKPFNVWFLSIFFRVGAENSTLMSISDGIGPYIFRQKIGKTRRMRKEEDGKEFISRQRRHFSLLKIMIKVLFPALYPHLLRKQLCFPPSKRYKYEKWKC